MNFAARVEAATKDDPVAEWRGRCLDFFARSERAIGGCIEAAQKVGKVVKIRHLAGQRLADLIVLAENEGATTKQARAFATALQRWQKVECRRQFLAHGVATESRDARQNWVAIFDVTTYPIKCRNARALGHQASGSQRISR